MLSTRRPRPRAGAPAVRALLGCVLSCLLLASAAAGQVHSVSSGLGTVGTRFAIRGTGFGPKPRVFLSVGEQKAKKTRLKVVDVGKEVGLERITVEVRRASAGSYGLIVQPTWKLAAPMPALQTFTIVPPEIISVSPAVARPGDEVQVIVDQAGDRKLRFRFRDRRARILGRPALHPVDGGAPMLRYRVRVPRLPEGTWSVSCTNPVGTTTLPLALEVIDSPLPLGKPRLRAVVQGKSFVAKGKHLGARLDGDALCLFGMVGGKSSSSTLSIRLPWNGADVSAPAQYMNAPGDLRWIVEAEAPDYDVLAMAAGSNGGAWAVYVHAFDGTAVAGSFQGTILPPAPIGGAPVDAASPLGGPVVLRGTFVVPFPPPGSEEGESSLDEFSALLGGEPFRAVPAGMTLEVSGFEPRTTVSAFDPVSGDRVWFSITHDPAQARGALFDGVAAEPNGALSGLLAFTVRHAGVLHTQVIDPQDGASSMAVTLGADPAAVLAGQFAGSVRFVTSDLLVQDGAFRIAGP